MIDDELANCEDGTDASSCWNNVFETTIKFFSKPSEGTPEKSTCRPGKQQSTLYDQQHLSALQYKLLPIT